MARLKVKYTEEIAPALMKKFQYKSVMQIPQIAKVIVNVGCGESKNNAKEIEAICKDIATITGQKPITTKARKSVANFKVREGETVGVKVTLRGDKMWEFLDRLFNVALPRVRDFRGINPNAFDGRGNYAMGLKEQLIFPRHGHLHLHHRDDRRGSQGTADHGRRSVPRLIGRKNTMARKAMILKQQAGNKFSTRRYNRCKICGRPHAYLRDYGVCRICFRELAYKGEIPGVKKASW